MEIITKMMVIDSGVSLKTYLEKCGLYISNVSGIESNQNCMFLPDKTSFNWKSRSGVRVNCKNKAKTVVEQITGLIFEENYTSDITREFSLVIDNEDDLMSVIEALKTMEGNAIVVESGSELLSGNLMRRRDDLENGIKKVLQGIPVNVSAHGREVHVNFQEILICGLSVEADGYKIYNVSSDWANKTTYLCDETEEGIWSYYLETIDECIGETQRLVLFEAQKGTKKNANNDDKSSEIRKFLTVDVLEKAYKAFMEQADKNALSKKSQGVKIPYGFSEKPKFDGAYFNPHYGQGSPLKSPYMNWWVVSIYYLPEDGNIYVGIQKDRYPHVKKMKISPLRNIVLPNKMVIDVYYSTRRDSIDYTELHKHFINVCEEVIRLGLE